MTVGKNGWKGSEKKEIKNEGRGRKVVDREINIRQTDTNSTT